jgi:hypothetical protein
VFSILGHGLALGLQPQDLGRLGAAVLIVRGLVLMKLAPQG